MNKPVTHINKGLKINKKKIRNSKGKQKKLKNRKWVNLVYMIILFC